VGDGEVPRKRRTRSVRIKLRLLPQKNENFLGIKRQQGRENKGLLRG